MSTSTTALDNQSTLALNPQNGSPRDVRLTRSLRWFAYSASVCTTTGTLLYCYDESLAVIRSPLIWTHNISGDLALILAGVYLFGHLRRTWRLFSIRPLSWWTGAIAVLCWILIAIGGIWGQFAPLDRYSVLWWTHAVGGIAAVVLTSAHAAYGFRAKFSARNA